MGALLSNFKLKARSRRPPFSGGRIARGNSRKAAFRLRLRAGLAAPNRVWDFSRSNQWSWFSANVRIRTAMDQLIRRTLPTNCRMAAGVIQIENN